MAAEGCPTAGGDYQLAISCRELSASASPADRDVRASDADGQTRPDSDRFTLCSGVIRKQR
jgi:hypothetical protein